MQMNTAIKAVALPTGFCAVCSRMSASNYVSQWERRSPDLSFSELQVELLGQWLYLLGVLGAKALIPNSCREKIFGSQLLQCMQLRFITLATGTCRAMLKVWR